MSDKTKDKKTANEMLEELKIPCKEVRTDLGLLLHGVLISIQNGIPKERTIKNLESSLTKREVLSPKKRKLLLKFVKRSITSSDLHELKQLQYKLMMY